MEKWEAALKEHVKDNLKANSEGTLNDNLKRLKMLLDFSPLESRLIPVDLDPEQDYGVLEKGAKYEEDAGYDPRLKISVLRDRRMNLFSESSVLVLS